MRLSVMARHSFPMKLEFEIGVDVEFYAIAFPKADKNKNQHGSKVK